jgi:hypothetical protein
VACEGVLLKATGGRGLWSAVQILLLRLLNHSEGCLLEEIALVFPHVLLGELVDFALPVERGVVIVRLDQLVEVQIGGG